MTEEVIKFGAEFVETSVEKFTDDYTVYTIYFGEGDPEIDGEHWNFQRSLEDDDGVCTVKEIQRWTVYEGITNFQLFRTNLICEFDKKTSLEAGVEKLKIIIYFQMDNKKWSKLKEVASIVFKDRDYFQIQEDNFLLKKNN
jgi:hypothetical protein